MILPLLKEHTASSHQRVETLVGVMDDALSRGYYVALLGAMFSFYRPLEAKLQQLKLPPEFEFERRRKVPWLERDLLTLDASLPEPAPEAALPQLSSLAGALGCLYVMEGATLGGQIISRHLGQQLGLGPGAGAAFFSSYGAEVGPMWRSFGAALTAYVARTGETQTVLSGAERTFLALERWLGRLHDRPELEPA